MAASRIARAVIKLAAEGGNAATAEQIRNATEILAQTWADAKLASFRA